MIDVILIHKTCLSIEKFERVCQGNLMNVL